MRVREAGVSRGKADGAMSARILVADDSQIMREMLQVDLKTLGYEVILAEDGERALEYFSAERPDLLIVDVMMPKINGFQICRRVKSNPATRETPVILLTARVQEEDIFWGRDCGADEYITKPFRTSELERTIARLLKRRREEQCRTGDLEAERRRRREQGRECRIVTLCWDARAMNVFRKKYGEIRFSEAVRVLHDEVEAFLDERDEPGPVGVRFPSGLTTLLEGSRSEIALVADDLVGRLSALAAGLYDPDDRDRGYVPLRGAHGGREERLPLLSFTAQIETE